MCSISSLICRTAIAATVFTTTLLPGLSLAQASHRLALVIGNQNYTQVVGLLHNPLRDIDLVASALKVDGFAVTKLADANRVTMLKAVDDFSFALGSLGPGAIGFVYYSGHGVAKPNSTSNFLIPVDVTKVFDAEFWYNSIAVDQIEYTITNNAPDSTVVIAIDACRNELRVPLKAAVKGFVFPGSASGIYLAFSTSPNQSASDDGDDGGPYANVLAAQLSQPGLTELQLFQNVKTKVFALTKGNQRPIEVNGLIDPVVLNASAPQPVDAKTSPDQNGSHSAKIDAKVNNDKVSAVSTPPAEGEAQNSTRSGDSKPGSEEATVSPHTAPVIADNKSGDLVTAQTVAPASNALSNAHTDSSVTAPEKQAAVVSKLPPIVRGVPVAFKSCVPDTFSLTSGRLNASAGSVSQVVCPLRSLSTFRECATCPEMIVMPRGSFTMGSDDSELLRYSDEGPRHEVTFKQPFAMAKFQVTVANFSVFASETNYRSSSCYGWNGSTFDGSSGGYNWQNPGFVQGDDEPVTCVNWADANAYAEWLSRKSGHKYRLPTEAEWEFSARGVTTSGVNTPYFFGSDVNKLCSFGNLIDYTTGYYVFRNLDDTPNCNDGFRYTSPVGRFGANSFGLFDMLGNVLQWTSDCHHDNYVGAPVDGLSWAEPDCKARVLRGGSWANLPRAMRAAFRRQGRPAVRMAEYGIRVARDLVVDNQSDLITTQK